MEKTRRAQNLISMYDSPCLFQNTMNANILQEKMDRKWNVKTHAIHHHGRKNCNYATRKHLALTFAGV